MHAVMLPGGGDVELHPKLTIKQNDNFSNESAKIIYRIVPNLGIKF